jgi:DNA-binding response OmpR family regulator
MPKSIVVMEDSDEIARIVLFKLKNTGFEVRRAINGREGLEILSGVKPDIIVLDAMMPVMNGFEVLAELKKNVNTRNIPVIMLTSLSSKTDVVLGLELGADDYITKPFSPKELVVRINKLLDRHDEV